LNWAAADDDSDVADENVAANDKGAAAGPFGPIGTMALPDASTAANGTSAGLVGPHGPISTPAVPAGADETGAVPSVATGEVTADNNGPRLRRHGVPVRVGGFQEKRDLEGSAACLHLRNNGVLTVAYGKYLARGAALRRGGKQRQIFLASLAYLGTLWLDCIEYRAARGVRRVGRPRVVVTGVKGRPVLLLVVERARSVAAVAGCPFAAYGRTRLRFDVRDVGVIPVLVWVPVSRVFRVLCVEQDWVNWVGRHGLEDMPIAVPTTRQARFFTNFFVNLSTYINSLKLKTTLSSPADWCTWGRWRWHVSLIARFRRKHNFNAKPWFSIERPFFMRRHFV